MVKKQAIDYTSFRIRRTTLKKIKVASVKADMSIAKFIDLLLESYLKKQMWLTIRKINFFKQF
jgi:hypothetical protein